MSQLHTVTKDLYSMIFSQSKVNSRDSINGNDNTHSKATFIGNEFFVGREAPMHHNDGNGNRIHDPSEIDK